MRSSAADITAERSRPCRGDSLPGVRITRLAAAAALIVPLAACGDDDTGPGTPEGAVEVVGNDDLTWNEDTYTAEAGEVTFVLRNGGSLPHTLLIQGVEGFKLSVGNRDEGSVELEAGSYEIYCDVPGHEQAGMVADLEVS